ncbi:hypothetical protein G7Y89_g15518 [Cudoniella acicularis]|uniref:GATA-type domain-containing protein n=1 Tax=Cudoniella acicularis TaxID=354080 RepID=A0A8H4QLP1_9HELO|nr:hypothetical protein G7Y89_g15518 [Cudoniella acicularis]
MSFGYSIGDFIAAISLILDVSLALREAGGSASEYQHFITELLSLKTALEQVATLEPMEDLEEIANAIKKAATTCREPLSEFLANVRHYDASLSKCQSSGVVKDVAMKVRWRMSKKTELIAKLRSELMGYVGGINMLIGFYQMKCASRAERISKQNLDEAQNGILELGLRVSDIQETVKEVRDQVTEDTGAIRAEITNSSIEISSGLQFLQTHVTQSLRNVLQTIGCLPDVASKTYAKTLEIYNIVVTLQSHVPKPNTEHTWFQRPMYLEDAFGRPITIGPEFNFAMVEAVIRARFQEGRGKRLVEKGQWQLLDARNTRKDIDKSSWEYIPGMNITMVIIIPQINGKICCPRPDCLSTAYLKAPGGGNICASCEVWFDEVVQSTRAHLTELPPEHAENTTSWEHGGDHSDNDGDEDADDLRYLKNVRFRKKVEEKERAAPPGRCHSCNRAETPEWRRGPDGARTLCNACGLHYAKLTRKVEATASAEALVT